MVMPGAGQHDHGVQHLLDHLGVERRGRLVEQHDLGLHAQGARDGDALLLPAGKLARDTCRLLGDADPGEVLHRQLLRLPFRHLAHPDRRQGAVLQDGEVGEQVEGLEHHADLAADGVERLEVVAQLDAVHHDAALLVLLQAVDAADQRGLARARGAADHHALAQRHVERDVAQHVQRAEPLVDALQADGGRGIGADGRGDVFGGGGHGRVLLSGGGGG
jgi:hypothetical protein